MTKYTTVLSKMLSPLSRSDFGNIVKGLKTDKYTKSFSTYDLFKTLVYGQIIGAFSVREIVCSLKANARGLYHAGLKLVSRSTFCDALEKRTAAVFQHVFYILLEKVQAVSGGIGKKFNKALRIIDSTTISLCIKRMDWARFRKAKGAVKIHTLLDGDGLYPLNAYITNGLVHDVKVMPVLCRESGVIYVADRGYLDFNSLYHIEINGSLFVTRVKTNAAFRRIKNLPHGDNGSIISDTVIELSGPAVKKRYPKPLRKVKYHDEETKKVYEFLTNDMESPAGDIAAMYKERWQIELFFKFLKQNLKIKTFWGTGENAVKSQIWIALILSILLWLNKLLEGISSTIHEMLQMLKTTMLCKGSLVDLENGKPPPLKYDSLQPLLEGLL